MTKAKEMKERSEHAARLLSDCVPPAQIVHTLAEEYGVSPQAARAYVKRGKQLITDSLDQSDVKYYFSKIMHNLEVDHKKALEEGNVNAAVGSTKAMVHHYKQIVHIDPMGRWDAALEMEATTAQVIPGEGKVDPITGLEIDPVTGRFIQPDETPF